MHTRYSLWIPLVLFITGASSFSHAEEWWHGTFVPRELAMAQTARDSDEVLQCTDASVRYSASDVFPWETRCEIRQSLIIRAGQAIWLSLDCGYPDGPGGYQKHELLMRLGDSRNMLRYAPAGTMVRCEW